VVFFLAFLRRLPHSTRRGLWTAGVLFVGGAIGIEMFAANFVSLQVTNIAFVLSVTVKETLEMLGIAVFLTTLLAYIPRGVPNVWWSARVVASAHAEVDGPDHNLDALSAECFSTECFSTTSVLLPAFSYRRSGPPG
jgi:hypothetical protein